MLKKATVIGDLLGKRKLINSIGLSRFDIGRPGFQPEVWVSEE
jgi:hypothetical protein